MTDGKVLGIFICPKAGEPMVEVSEVEAFERAGLAGDRYATGAGSGNKGAQGKRQVTLINGLFIPNSGFTFAETRRNIVTMGVELNYFIGRGEFKIGGVRMRAVKYCDSCERPNTLSGNKRSFRDTFFDRGGIIAEVVEGGIIRVGDTIVPPPRG